MGENVKSYLKLNCQAEASSHDKFRESEREPPIRCGSPEGKEEKHVIRPQKWSLSVFNLASMVRDVGPFFVQRIFWNQTLRLMNYKTLRLMNYN